MHFNCMAIINHRKAFDKPFLLFILLIFVYSPNIGQTALLPVDDNGKVEYFNSVETDSIDYHTLWDNAGEFLSTLSVTGQLKKEVQANENLSELTHQFGFYLFVKPTLTKQIDGIMIADITIKINDSQYMYYINNFKFIKYARDRFGQFAPKSSKRYPLELYYPDNTKKTWKTHYAEINGKIIEIQQKIEAKMIK